MSLLPSLERSPKQLREFGLTMGLMVCAIGGYLLWKDRNFAPEVLLLGVLFAGLGILAPQSLRQVDKYWLKLGLALGVVFSHVILTLMYFLVMTPMGLLLRLFGKDLLSMKLAPEAETYWIPTEKDGPSTRPFTPY